MSFVYQNYKSVELRDQLVAMEWSVATQEKHVEGGRLPWYVFCVSELRISCVGRSTSGKKNGGNRTLEWSVATQEKHAAMVAKKQRGMKEPPLVVVGFLKRRGGRRNLNPRFWPVAT